MSTRLAHYVHLAIHFFRTSLGVINSPYVTFRRISTDEKYFNSVWFLYILGFLYFIWVSLLKTGTSHPIVLSIHINLLLQAAVVGIGLMVLVLYTSAKFILKSGSLKTIFLLYSYSLLPTIIWFSATSLLFLLFPPPRTLSVFGKLLSVSYIAFSIGMLWWKLILYYLTLRFSCKLNLSGFVRVSLIFLPTVCIYALLMYHAGIFRIPFI